MLEAINTWAIHYPILGPFLAGLVSQLLLLSLYRNTFHE